MALARQDFLTLRNGFLSVVSIKKKKDERVRFVICMNTKEKYDKKYINANYPQSHWKTGFLF